MDREIKFRGKCIYPGIEAEGNFLKLIYGDLHKRDNEWFIYHDNQWFEVDKETVGQYTGFKDKNFKEIYEGDIVAERTMGGINYSVVKFGEINISKQACKEKPCICFYNDYSNFNDCWSDEPLNAKKIEVIGNIYENTELLNS